MSAPALALREHVYRASFGSQGSGNGQFREPSGVAVNEVTLGDIGDLYVVDKGNGRVEVFNAEGSYLSQFNGSASPAHGLSAPEAIAIDDSTTLEPSVGDVYVTDTGNGVIDKFSAAGAYEGQLTGTCAAPGTCPGAAVPFGPLRGVAVDGQGNLWVFEGEQLQVDEFSATGSFIKSFNSERGTSPGFALDSLGNAYIVFGNSDVGKFEAAAGTQIGQEFGGENTTALAVDRSTNGLFVDTGSSIVDYGPVGEPPTSPLASFPGEGLSGSHGIVVNAGIGAVYATQSDVGNVERFDEVVVPDVSSEAASNETTTGVTLHGVVDPDGEQVTSCGFEYGTDTTYGQTAPCEPAPQQIGAGNAPVAVSAELTGLRPNTTYHFRVEAGDANGLTPPSSDRTLTTASESPLVDGESFSNVGSSSATLDAQLDAIGLPSTYYYEYGTSSAYGTTTATKSLGAAHGDVNATAQLEDLQPDTVYHFRVVATNSLGSTAGADTSFTTSAIGVVGLPDDRSYEMVSPVANADGNVYEPHVSNVNINSNGDNTELPFQAAADGHAIAYVGESPPTGGTGSEGSYAGNEYLATRAAGGGWSASDIEPPSGRITEKPIYEAFSNDLSVGILNWNGVAPLTPGAPGEGYNVLYLRNNDDGSYRSLINTPPPHRAPGESEEAFGAYEGLVHGGGTAPVYAGSSADLEHLLFVANDALTPAAVDGGPTENNLYDSSDGRLHLVNVLPDGSSQPNASFGSPPKAPEEEGHLDSANFSHVISDDGSRIFWSSLNGSGVPSALYVRVQDTTTVEVDATQGGPDGSGGGRFWFASSDGSRVFFTDENRLTSDSTAAPGAPDLYRYDLESAHLTDLTVDTHAGEQADVQGVVGASSDGSYIYFVADGVLAAGAAAQQCEPSEASTGCNLYVIHEGEAPKLIAELSGRDDRVAPVTFSQQDYGDWRPGLGNRVAEVTPDGRHLAFMSERDLAGYDSREKQEVYVYDAASGRLTCASCDPNGEPPTTPYEGSAWLQPSYSNTHMPDWMSADGTRVFFDTAEALVPQDTNGRVDVYEWEQVGAGSCRRAGGCVYLLSGGESTDNSYFADASATGDDVFIVTRAQLAAQDGNGAFDLYDARVDAAAPLAPPACTGAGCQGVPPAPPSFATPPSLTYDGIGNFAPPVAKSGVRSKPKALTRAQKLAKALKACRQKPKKRRAACVKQAAKHYAPAKQKGKR